MDSDEDMVNAFQDTFEALRKVNDALTTAYQRAFEHAHDESVERMALAERAEKAERLCLKLAHMVAYNNVIWLPRLDSELLEAIKERHGQEDPTP